MLRRTFISNAGIVITGASSWSWPFGAKSQDFPSRPLTIVVPYSAGGPSDTLTRLLAERMQSLLRQNILIDNVTGAGGALGVTRVARATPDGYTISTGNPGSHITVWALQPTPFDLTKDLAPVILFATNPQLIVARKTIEATSLPELLAWLKANPGKATLGGGGLGSIAHFAALYFEQQSGTTVQFVPYRGAAPAMQDLLAGQIDLMIDQAANCLPHVRSGKIKAFAVAAGERLAAAPDIPTAEEAGLRGFQTAVWHGMWVPSGTPGAVIARLNGAAREALASPELKQRFADLGQEIPPAEQRTPQALDAFQKSEIKKWGPLMKVAKGKTE
jgi:tripartite-type tricarboxylate transporter receptor subunit TctC